MDPLMDVLKNTEEPGWLESNLIGDLRVWQVIFLCWAGITFLIVMVCCCFRFRIPRTKQQIEADYQRRLITSKFRQQLETIQDAKMDAMSLSDVCWSLCTLLALELLHGKKKEMEGDQQNDSSSNTSPRQGSLDTQYPGAPQKPAPQVAGQGFAKVATKVANLSKVAQTKPVNEHKMDF